MALWPKEKALKQAGTLYTLQSGTVRVYHAYMMSLLPRVLGWTSEDAYSLCKAAHAPHYKKRSRIHGYNKL